jgi:hypothetical protein
METIILAVGLAFAAAFLCNLLHWRLRGGKLFYEPTSLRIRVFFTTGLVGGMAVAAGLYALRYAPASVFVVTAIGFATLAQLYSLLRRFGLRDGTT